MAILLGIGLALSPRPSGAQPPSALPFSIKDSRLLETTETCRSRVTITVNEDHVDLGKASQIEFVQNVPRLWCPGARHTWVGTSTGIRGGAIDRIESDRAQPLVFEVTADGGYAYRSGKGSVTLPDSGTVSLPLAAGKGPATGPAIRVTVVGADAPGWTIMLFDDPWGTADSGFGIIEGKRIERGEGEIFNRLAADPAKAGARATAALPPDGKVTFLSLQPGPYRVAAIQVRTASDVSGCAVTAQGSPVMMERNGRGQLSSMSRGGPDGSYDERGAYRRLAVVSEQMSVSQNAPIAVTLDVACRRKDSLPATTASVAAIEGPPPSGAQATFAAQACIPECRAGFICSQGQCVSPCNPPCPVDYACTADRRCISR